MKSQRINDIIAAVLLTVLGIIFIVWKSVVIGIAMTVLGVMLIVQGVIDLVGRMFVSAVIKAVLGILIISFGWAVAEIALYVMAVVLLVYGIIQLVGAIKMLRVLRSTVAKIFGFVQPCMCLFIAISLLFNQGGTVATVFIVAGVFLIIQGVLALIDCLVKR